MASRHLSRTLFSSTSNNSNSSESFNTTAPPHVVPMYFKCSVHQCALKTVSGNTRLQDVCHFRHEQKIFGHPKFLWQLKKSLNFGVFATLNLKKLPQTPPPQNVTPLSNTLLRAWDILDNLHQLLVAGHVGKHRVEHAAFTTMSFLHLLDASPHRDFPFRKQWYIAMGSGSCISSGERDLTVYCPQSETHPALQSHRYKTAHALNLPAFELCEPFPFGWEGGTVISRYPLLIQLPLPIAMYHCLQNGKLHIGASSSI